MKKTFKPLAKKILKMKSADLGLQERFNRNDVWDSKKISRMWQLHAREMKSLIHQ